MHPKTMKPGPIPHGSMLDRALNNMAFLMDAQPETTGAIAGGVNSHPGGEVSVATTGGSAANIVPFNPTK